MTEHIGVGEALHGRAADFSLTAAQKDTQHNILILLDIFVTS